MEMKHTLYTLDNGMRVLLIPDTQSYSVTIYASVKAGSAYENKKSQGVTHFIEHVSTLATKSWPDKEDLTKIREFNGAYLNAYTSNEVLKYYIDLPYSKLEFGVQSIKEILYDATYDEKYIEQERSTILDEIKVNDDNPYFQAWRFFTETLVQQRNNGYKLPTGGTVESVSSFTKNDLLEIYKSIHSPEKVLISIVGNFDTKEAKAIIDKHFSDIKRFTDRIGFTKNIAKELPNTTLETGIKKSKKSTKTDLILTNIVIPVDMTQKSPEKDIMMIKLTSLILGGPLSSRLKNRLREKEGLLYDISALAYIKQKFGELDISFDTTKENAQISLSMVQEELAKFITHGVPQKELEHYKEYTINRTFVEYDSIKSYSSLLINLAFLGLPLYSLEEYIKMDNEITLEEINKFIKDKYSIEKTNILQYGNV